MGFPTPFAWLLALSLTLAACAGVASGGIPSPSSPSPSVPPSAGVVMVTMASDRQTVTAHVGDRIQVALGEQYAWRLDPPDGVVLVQPVSQTYLLVRGTQAIWEARAAGPSTIRATGTVVCPSGQACIQIAILFSATVDVQP